MKPRLPTVPAPVPAGPVPETTLPGGNAAGAGMSGPALVVNDSGRVLRVPLGRSPLTIGRDPSSNIVLASRFVSAKHARIEPDGAGHKIIDLGAMNGLLRAGRRIPRS